MKRSRTITKWFWLVAFWFIVLTPIQDARTQVSDGQPVNAATTNGAFLYKNGDSTDLGKLSLNNAADPTVSGSSVTNVQRELNALSSFTGKPLNQVYNYTPAWSNNDVGSSTDSVKARVDTITALFNGTSGHGHSGAAGDGPILTGYARSNLSNIASTAAGASISPGVNDTYDLGNLTPLAWHRIYFSNALTMLDSSANSIISIGQNVTQPDSTSGNVYVTGGSNHDGRDFAISTVSGSANTGPIKIMTGNAIAGDSGGIMLRTGTASGTQGKIEVNADINPMSGFHPDIGTASLYFNSSAIDLMMTSDVADYSGNTRLSIFTDDSYVRAINAGNVIFAPGATGVVESQKPIKLDGATSGALTISPAASTTSHTLTFPSAQGAANTPLVNNGSGTLAWGGTVSATLSAAGNILLNSHYLSNDGGNEGISVDNSGGVTLTHASNTPSIHVATGSTEFDINGGNITSGTNTTGGTVEVNTGLGTGTGTSEFSVWTPLWKASGSTAQDTLHRAFSVTSSSSTAAVVSVQDTMTVGAASGTTGSIGIKGTTSGTVTLSVADAAGTYTMKMPTAQGASDTVLVNDGSGNLSWSGDTTGSTFTPTISGSNQGNIGNASGRYWIGKGINKGYILLDIYIDVTGTLGGASVTTITLPNSYTIDTAKDLSADNNDNWSRGYYGNCEFFQAGVAWKIVRAHKDDSTSKLRFNEGPGWVTDSEFVKPATDRSSIYCQQLRVPITGL